MSCGKHHDTPCSEVLAELFVFLDAECDEGRRGLIESHLDECGPCLKQYGLEQAVKTLIGRKCGGDPAPAGLRERVRVHLRSIVVTSEGERE